MLFLKYIFYFVHVFSWFFGSISSREACNLLLSQSNRKGSFLIRYSEKDENGFALSLRTMDDRKMPVVKHYTIRKFDKVFYIDRKDNFRTLDELVEHYQGKYMKV